MIHWMLASLLLVAAVSAQGGADWPCYNHGVRGWRYNPDEHLLGPSEAVDLVELWRFPRAGSDARIGVVHATPAVVAGEVYFGTATFPAFYKLSADGELLWRYTSAAASKVRPPVGAAPVSDKLRGAASEAGIFSSPLVHDGAVYFADTGGWIYSLTATDGAERWRVNTRGARFPDPHWNNLLMASPIFADGKVVFGGGTLEQAFAGTSDYAGSTGRGFVVALDPNDGAVVWKHDVGEPPRRFKSPVALSYGWGEHRFEAGPATSSVWSTPSYDADTNTIFFGTDVNTAPRQPTEGDPRLHTEDSCAVRAVDAATGALRWNTQLNPGDVWTNAMRAYDPQTGRYKDGSVGDTPKVVDVEVAGVNVRAVGVGCKNGGFFLLRASDGELLRSTPLYTGPPTHPPAEHDPRVLALPSPIGGLQSGCATDGKTWFTNGIDAVRLGTLRSYDAAGQVPTAGRVTATSLDLSEERWRHERPKIPEMGGDGVPLLRDVGDVVASGVALGNGVAWFTAVGSGKLVGVAMKDGRVLCERELGPVFAGPALSRGRVYVGSGNTLFSPVPAEVFFPKRYTGHVHCFGLR